MRILLSLKVLVSDGRLGSRCPSGWMIFKSQCCNYFTNPKTWAEAEKHCRNYGGNLASVQSQSTNDFLKLLLRTQVGRITETWIGAHDAPQDSIWLWSDGSTFEYSDWHTGEPNNYGGPEDCVEMGFGGEKRWNDLNCGTRLPFICCRKV